LDQSLLLPDRFRCQLLSLLLLLLRAADSLRIDRELTPPPQI
jgi:hypothetical protein